VKTKAKNPSKLEAFHRLKEQALAELLEKRKDLKRQLKQEVARFEEELEENATQLQELGYKVKGSFVGAVSTGKNLRLPDEEIKKQLEKILAGKQLSIPVICQHLRIARTRFVAFDKKHKGFLGSKGKGKLTVYFVKNAKA